MKCKNNFYYNKNESPLLAGIEGLFQFEEQELTLSILPLGNLVLPSGLLAVVDPFADMIRGGNLGILLQSGVYPVLSTIAHYPIYSGQNTDSNNKENDSFHPPIYTSDVLKNTKDVLLNKNLGDGNKDQISEDQISEPIDKENSRKAYLSLILDKEEWEKRQSWVHSQLEHKKRYFIPIQALRFLHLTADGNPPSDLAQLYEDEFVGVPVSSGSCAFVDDQSLVDGMPPDSPGTGWADKIFDHKTPNSWFDIMDSDKPLPHGLANILLPLAKETPWGKPNLILSESGYGDGYYAVIGEYAFDHQKVHDEIETPPKLIAIHVDFKVVAQNSNTPVAQNSGPR